MKHLTFAAEFKADREDGTFSGYGNVSGNIDSAGDRVIEGAFARDLAKNGGRRVLLWQHDPASPIGTVDLVEDSHGLRVKKGRLTLGVQRADEAYLLLKAGALTGMSIGYEVVKSRPATGGVRELTEIATWEISLVSFPANTLARVDDVKGEEAAALSAMIASMRAETLTARDRRDLELLTKALRDIRREAEANQPMFFKALKGDRR